MTKKTLTETRISSLQSKIVMFFVAIVVLGWSIIYYTLPQLQEVKILKEETQKAIDKYKEYVQTWLPIWVYKSNSSQNDIRKLLDSEWGAKFFETHLRQSQTTDYLEFLDEKQTFIDSSKEVLAQRDEQVATVLPSYTSIYDDGANLSDAKFVNYLERLFRTFSLTTQAKFGVDAVVPVNKDEQNLDKQIFYIPVKLDLTGQKSKIAAFLYYIQNVGILHSSETTQDKNTDENNLDDTATSESENNEWEETPEKIVPQNIKLEFLSDTDRILALNQIRSMTWDSDITNLFETQLIDIEVINFSKYIATDDGSHSMLDNDRTAAEFVRNNIPRDNEEYTISLSMRFYVRGMPIYKIESFVENTIQTYDALSQRTEQHLSRIMNSGKTEVWQNISLGELTQRLKTLQSYLANMWSTIEMLRSALATKENLNDAYMKASQLHFDLANIASYVPDGVNIEESTQ